MNNRNLKILLAGALLVATPWLGAAPAMADASGQLTIAIPAEPESLTPRKDLCSFASHWIADNVYDRLTRRQPDGSVAGWLAESFQRIDDLTWRFKLRQGVKFTDGEPFNADAIVANVNYQLDPSKQTLCIGDFNSLKSATKVDDYTVDVKTSKPDPIFPTDFGMGFLIAAPNWLTTKSDSETAVAAVGTGPYILTKWDKGQELTLEANKDYWGDPKPSIETIHLLPRGEGQVRADMIKTGEADIAINLNKDLADALPKSVVEPTTESVIIRLNILQDQLKDPRVRQAIIESIDTNSIVTALFPGIGSTLNGQMARPGALGYNPDIKPYPYDPADAKKLVDAAGATGATLNLVTRTDLLPNVAELAEALQGMIEQSGLKVNIVPDDPVVWRQALVARGPGQVRSDMLLTSAKNQLLDASRQIDLYFGNGLASNADDAAFADASAKAETLNGADRDAAYRTLWQQVHDNFWVVPLFGSNYLHGMSAKVQWTPRSDGYAFFNTITLAN